MACLQARASAILLVSLTSACGPFGDPLENSIPTSVSVSKYETFECTDRPKIDVLFVISDSPARWAEQRSIAESFAGLGAMLDSVARNLDADYRVAFTSAHVDGAHCADAGSPAEDGAFVTTPCRARLEDFVADDPLAEVADQTAACTAVCTPERASAVSFAFDSPAARPWIERRDPASAAPPGAEPADMFACLAPMGVSGCRYPAPLAAARRALERTLDPSDPAHGFLRPDATLQLVFVGGAPDCSLGQGGASLLDPAGDRVFWSDPGAMVAPPGTCWNAGVECSASVATGPGDCWPVDKDATGEIAAVDEEPVLEPVSDAIAFLRGLIDGDHTRDVGVIVVTGVPRENSGEPSIPYTRVCDDAQLAEYGVCPGCEEGELSATPPVRLRELAAAFPWREGPMLSSICGDFRKIYADFNLPSWPESLRPACVDHCVADVDEERPGLQPRCSVRETMSDGTHVELPECARSLGVYAPPPGSDACVIYKTDVVGEYTPEDPDDDLGAECAERGNNLQLQIARVRPAPDHSCLSVMCELSTFVPGDCPHASTW